MMMKRALALSLLLLGVYGCAAQPPIYDAITDTPMLIKGFRVTTFRSGLELDSINTYQNQEGDLESITTIYIVGPFANVKSLDDGIQRTLDFVHADTNVRAPYRREEHLYHGVSIVITDLNGIKVANLKYKSKDEPNTYGMYSLVMSTNGLYSFSIVMHESHPDDKRLLRLVAILIVAVNSGKL